jgi:Family of unknown function (DUF5677)
MSELTRITNGLLNELSDVLTEWKSSVPDMSQDFPDWFAYEHSRNVRDLVAAILILRNEGKIGPMRVLIRVCLESYFNLAASFKVTDFPKNKVHSELRNQKTRVSQWRGLKMADQAEDLDMVEAQTDEMMRLFTDNVGVATDKNSWDTFNVAEASEGKAHYRTAYFTYSQHVHAVFGVLMNAEGETGKTIDSSVQVISSLVALVAGLVVNYRKQPDANERRTRIALLSIDLAKLTGWEP